MKHAESYYSPIKYSLGGDFSWAAQARDTTSTLDIYSTIGTLESVKGMPEYSGKFQVNNCFSGIPWWPQLWIFEQFLAVHESISIEVYLH